MSIKLPTVITDCDEYETLTDEHRASYLHRLESVRELGVSLSDGTRRSEDPEFCLFVEELELDASQLQEFRSPWDGGPTRWLMHYSWTFDTSPGRMRHSLSSLSPALLKMVDSAEPRSDAPLASSERYLEELGSRLVQAVDAIFAASTYDSAMAHQIAMDIMLNRLLAVCFRLRLNPLLRR